MINVCVFDLECSSLNADFGIILCGVIKPQGQKKPIIFRADDLNKSWKTRRSDDSAVTSAIAAELDKYDILIGHNASMFDIPFLRTRLARWGLPAFPKKKLIDPVKIARWQFRLTSNSLQAITSHLGIPGKTHVDGRIWSEASLDGCPKAMSTIVKHCVDDVVVLEKIVDAVKPYCSQFDTRGSSW